MKVVVVMGGNTTERDVSLRTGAGVGRALQALGHEVLSVDTKDGGVEFYLRAIPDDTDLVFIALHGGDGENGTLQAFLDMARIPYTGSGMLARCLAEGFPSSMIKAVAVGLQSRHGKQDFAGNVSLMHSPLDFARVSKAECPFPSCPNYDLKAWEICQAKAVPGALFWNVLAGAS